MSSDRTLLVADDDPGLRESLERALSREGYRVILASDGQAALERLQAGGIDLIVTDLKMPGLTGLELLRAAKAIAPDIDVILLTAFGTVEEAVKAMKDGAYDFLTKPFRREQLLKLIDKALERRDLIEKNRALQQRLDDLLRQGSIIGGSPAFRRMMMLVEQVASSSATVLVQGDSGTGKELVARAIHDRSARASNLSSRSIVLRSLRRYLNQSSSGTSGARSPERPAARKDASSSPTGARSSSTRWPISLP